MSARRAHRAIRAQLALLGISAALALVAGVALVTGAALLAPAPAAAAPSAPAVFINEFHYDNLGEDQNEGIEIAGAAGLDLSGYSLELYNGYDQKRYATVALTGTLPDQEAGFGTSFFPVPGLQNGAPDGIALIGPEGVIETLGYEGSFAALDGSAAGMKFLDIHQFEAPSTAAGESLQLEGVGNSAADFTWHEPEPATPGKINVGQHFQKTPIAPTNLAPPTITGNVLVGEALTCSAGEWEDASGGYSYEWNLDGMPTGTLSESFVAQGANYAQTLTCTVTATNETGSSSATSAGIEILAAPLNTSPPSIAGASEIGESQHCEVGGWEHDEYGYDYEWDLGGTPVGYSDYYTPDPGSAGQTLSCTITAYNSVGSARATSAGVEVKTQTPFNTSAPTISGNGNVGETQWCNVGSWENSPYGYSYEWLEDGLPLGSFSASLTVQSSDAGHTLSCTVTAVNSAGSAQATSAGMSIATPAPLNSVAPEIWGAGNVGETQHCYAGAWEYAPLEYDYEWALDGKVLSSGESYVVQAADKGQTLTCTVTASNATGSSQAGSAGIAITALAPLNTALPSISGTAEVGETLSCETGDWEGAAYGYSYEWDADGAPIAHSETHLVQGAEAGKTLTCIVSAYNSAGSTQASSEGVEVAELQAPTPPPLNVSLPAITGASAVGETPSCSNGSWQNSPTAYAYEWFVDGVAIGVGTQSFTVQSADAGHVLTCTVTATNVGGPTAASSAGVEVPIPPAPVKPLSSLPPLLSGIAKAGNTLSCSTGTWQGASSYAYQWLRDGAPITGATSAGYSLVASDVGHQLACRVIATNAAGSSESATNAVLIAAEDAPPAEPETLESGSLETSPAAASPPSSFNAPGLGAIPPPPTSGAVRASLASLLNPRMIHSALARLLAHGNLTFNFIAPGSGVLSIRWVLAGAHASRVGTSTVLASTTRSFGAAEHGPVRLRLTPRGRRLLRAHRTMHLVELVAFTPSGGVTERASASLRTRLSARPGTGGTVYARLHRRP